MDTQQLTPSFDESIARVMQTLPPVIRAYLAQGKYTVVAQNLMAKYGLRIDQGGVLERELMLLLMGVDTPDEFMKSLAEDARLDQKIVTGIVQDINAQVFVPLREEEMKSRAGNMQAPSAAPRQMAEPVSPFQSSGAIIPANPRMPNEPVYMTKVGPALSRISAAPRPPAGGQPQSNFHLQNKIVHPPLPRPTQPAAATPRLVPPPRPMPAAAPLVRGERLLEDHEEPHIEFSKTPPVPPRPALQGNVPPRIPPPVNLPGALPHPVPPPRTFPPGMRPTFVPAPNIAPRPAPVSPPSATSASAAPEPEGPAVLQSAPAGPPPSAPARPISADPYREPIEP